MPLLTQSDLSDLARYPASLRSAARALWGAQLAARSGAAHRATIHHIKKGAGAPPGDNIQ